MSPSDPYTGPLPYTGWTSDEPGLQDASVSDFLAPYLTLGGAKGIAAIPSDLKAAYGVLKGLGSAGKVGLGASSEGLAGAKAVNQGLKALTVPEEAVNAASILGKGPTAADLAVELKAGLQNAAPKDVITLSNGTKWRFDGIQKIGDKSEVLLEHLEGPVPAGIRQGVSTTLSTLEKAASGATPAIASDIAAQRALNAVEETGGSTFNMSKGELAGTPHYAVAAYPERELIIKGELTTKQIEQYMAKNQDLLSDASNSLGIWKDTETGKVYLDITKTLADKAEATKLGLEKAQKAIFNLKDMTEIRLDKGL